MKIKEIDTENKEITIDTTVNLGDLVHELKNLFKDNWKDWNIKVEYIVDYYPSYNPNIPCYPLSPNQPYYHDDFFNTTSNNMVDYDLVKKKGKD